MKKLNNANGGFPFTLDEIGFMESAVEDQSRINNAHLHPLYGMFVPRSTILEGCVIVDAAGTTTVSPGIIMINGYVYRFQGATYPTPDRITDVDCWVNDTISLGNSQQFQDGNFHDLHSEKIAAIEVITLPNPVSSYPISSSSLIWELIAQRLEQANPMPYQESIYTFQQSGTSAPTIVNLKQSGINVVSSSYEDVGEFLINFSGTPFADLSKLNISFSNLNGRNGDYIEVNVLNSNTLDIKTYNFTGTLANGQLDSFSLIIRKKI